MVFILLVGLFWINIHPWLYGIYINGNSEIGALVRRNLCAFKHRSYFGKRRTRHHNSVLSRALCFLVPHKMLILISLRHLIKSNTAKFA